VAGWARARAAAATVAAKSFANDCTKERVIAVITVFFRGTFSRR